MTKTIDLPDCDPKAFATFVDWLYEGRLSDRHKSEDLVDVWILADKIMVPNLQNDATDLLRVVHASTAVMISSEKTTAVFESGLDNTQLIKYIVDEVAYRLSTYPLSSPFSGDLEKALLVLDPKIMVRVVSRMRSYPQTASKGSQPCRDNSTKYHVWPQAGDLFAQLGPRARHSRMHRTR